MKLDRNVSADGRGKYGLVNNRRLEHYAKRDDAEAVEIMKAVRLLQNFDLIEWGLPETENEFFVIKLRDRYAGGALMAYASYAREDDEEQYAHEVMALAMRAGWNSKFCKKPD